MVVSSGTNYSDSSCHDILGKTWLAAEWQDHLYGNYLLSAGFGIYLCKYSIWNPIKAKDLAERFIKNFNKFTGNEAGKKLVAAGPKL